MKYVIGIDIGTTAVKVLLLSEKGAIAATDSVEYPLFTPEPNWAEQDPEDWWQGTVTAINNCLEKARAQFSDPIEIEAVGLTGQMHSSVFLDGDGRVLRHAILWCDQRTESQCEQIVDVVGFDRLISCTSNRALAGFTAPKILWLRRNEPEVFSKVQKVLLAKDYIRYKLTGTFATDVSDASGTLLFNVANRKWSGEMLNALDIPRNLLPDCYESTEITGYVSKEASDILGLSAATPVVAGGGDQAAGAVGNGVIRKGLASCVIGTSGVVFWHSDNHISDSQGRLHCFCHAVPGKWHLMGVTLAAGGSLRWFRDTLCQQEVIEATERGIDPYEVILEPVGGIDPGSEGLIFLPYLAGERTPHADASARGAFIGLSLRHTKPHLSRSVLEGITMSLKDCLMLGVDLGLTVENAMVSGGGSRNDVWRQMIADMFGMKVSRTNVDEGPAFGAAILASVGAGFHDSVEQACTALVSTQDFCNPAPYTVEKYSNLYKLYQPAYNMLKDHFKHSATFSSWG